MHVRIFSSYTEVILLELQTEQSGPSQKVIIPGHIRRVPLFLSAESEERKSLPAVQTCTLRPTITGDDLKLGLYRKTTCPENMRGAAGANRTEAESMCVYIAHSVEIGAW